MQKISNGFLQNFPTGFLQKFLNGFFQICKPISSIFQTDYVCMYNKNVPEKVSQKKSPYKKLNQKQFSWKNVYEKKKSWKKFPKKKISWEKKLQIFQTDFPNFQNGFPQNFPNGFPRIFPNRFPLNLQTDFFKKILNGLSQKNSSEFPP